MSNLYNEVCPDYLQLAFTEARLIFTVEGKSEGEAAAFLETIWHNAKDIGKWDNQHEAEVEANRLAKENETLEEERPLPATALLLPPQHALNKLRKGDYVPLHYFTNRGIHEAEEDTASTEDDILTLVQSDTSPTFQTSASIRVKECKVKDEHLTWEEFSQANYRMLNAMQQQDWPNIRDFWLALKGHKWRHNPSEYRKRALLIYQGKIRRDWHKTISTPDSFSLLPLEQEHLMIFHQELLDNVYTSKIEAMNVILFLATYYIFQFFWYLLHTILPIPNLYTGFSPIRPLLEHGLIHPFGRA
ncbi:hypothetical protein BDN67DRAFT_983784 [Paxillus ammoniavirescens]|nr:hypothetical protein BDN67DRAFT_983784 [Paxillus ammoniavirescens]